MADYRKMYHRMVDASEQVMELLESRRGDFYDMILWARLRELLRQGERDCEELYLEDEA